VKPSVEGSYFGTEPPWFVSHCRSAMKITAIAAATIIGATAAHADTYWYCKGDECVGRSVLALGQMPGAHQSPVNLSVWVLSQAATSASMACPNCVLAPLA
jgi:hypothetical protein